MSAECTITSDRQCSPCTAPSYSDDGLTCKQCDGEGQYNDINGASSCKSSPPGSKPTSDHTGIEACPLGTFSDDGVSCKECTGNGTYSDTTGAIYCKSAPAGFKPSPDRTSLVSCPSGTFSTGGTLKFNFTFFVSLHAFSPQQLSPLRRRPNKLHLLRSRQVQPI